MADVVTVAVVQQRTSGEWEKDRDRAAQRLEYAASQGAVLAVFPELFGWSWFAGGMDKTAFRLAETLDGPRVEAWRTLARAHRIAIAAPQFLHDGQGLYHNAVVAIDQAGEIQGVYRTVHVPQIPGWEGKFYFADGDDFPVFTFDGIPIGFLICWDSFFPEAFRALALRGARAIVVLTSATGGNEDLWTRALMANAFFNGVYVLRANRVGEEEHVSFCGASFAAAPTGDLLGEPMGEVEGVGLYSIDRKAVELTRREFPFLKDRRTRAYFDLADLVVRRRE